MTTDDTRTARFDVAPLVDGYVQPSADGYDPTMIFLPPFALKKAGYVTSTQTIPVAGAESNCTSSSR